MVLNGPLSDRVIHRRQREIVNLLHDGVRLLVIFVPIASVAEAELIVIGVVEAVFLLGVPFLHFANGDL